VPDAKTFIGEDRKVKVWTDYHAIQEHLTDDRYEHTQDPHEADIIWTHMDHYHLFEKQINLKNLEKKLIQ